ncbi:unnamed protein product [Lupinus luteus]|uniref:Uncharacterized protein n=1 Tax=Lupinus luteus TaxID=3873 RepID=A0AAV1Y1E9_LUPLU
MGRSTDHMELVDMKARSNNEMKQTLNWWDLIWFGVGAVIGAEIFVFTGLETREVAGPAVVLSYVVSGGSFAYLRVELGDFVAFIAAGNILLEYVTSSAAVARSWTSYFSTLCNKSSYDFRIVVHGMDPNYGHLDPTAIVVLTVITILTVFNIKGSPVFNYISSVIHVGVVIFIIVAGLINANPQNYTPFAPFGFDAVATMAEETKNLARDIPIGLVGSMVMITLAYCFLAATLCLMQPYKTINVDVPFSVAFSVIGCDWAKYIVSLGALKEMTIVLLVSVVGQTRYLTHIARIHMMPPWFAHVNEKTGTPVNATISMLVATSVIAFVHKSCNEVVCILSAAGAVSSVFMRHQSASTQVLKYEGCYETVSLYGSCTFSSGNGGARHKNAMLSVILGKAMKLFAYYLLLVLYQVSSCANRVLLLKF